MQELERELAAVTEQRDRLAEAMTRIKTIYENPEKRCIPSSSDMYYEAIQSLTTNVKKHAPPLAGASGETGVDP
jgi:signal transduction histidine kinase